MNVVDGWQHKKLTELAEYINGYAFKPEDWRKDGLPIIRIEQLKKPDTIIDYYPETLPEKNIIYDGDLIFSWSASLFLSIWKNGKAALNQHLFKVVEFKEINRIFLKQFIEFYLPEITKASHGSTMKHITRKELDRFGALFPLDINEQKKIAEVLSTVDQAIEQTEVLIAKQQRIKTGLMQDLLTRGIDKDGNLRSEETHKFKYSPLGRIPEGWEVKKIIEVAVKITDGDHHTPNRSEAGFYLLSARNIHNGFLDLGNVDFVPKSEYKRMSRRCNPESGDIFISCSGTIGRICEVPKGLECVLVRSVALVKLKQNKITSRFAEWCLRSQYLQQQIVAAQRQAAQPNLFQGEIEKLILPKPPIIEQQNITKILDALSEKINTYNIDLKKLKSIKTALMQDLLTGKKRVTPLLNRSNL